MAIAFYLVLFLSGGNDVIADKLKISLNAMTWGGRIGLLLIPPLAYYVALPDRAGGLQQHDREVLAHGVETGIIRRDPDGRFYEVAPAARTGGRPRAQPAGLRGLGGTEEDEPDRRAVAGRCAASSGRWSHPPRTGTCRPRRRSRRHHSTRRSAAAGPDPAQGTTQGRPPDRSRPGGRFCLSGG